MIQISEDWTYLKEGATKEDAALWRMLTPIKRMKDALSCSKTYFTVVSVLTSLLEVKTDLPKNKCEEGGKKQEIIQGGETGKLN